MEKEKLNQDRNSPNEIVDNDQPQGPKQVDDPTCWENTVEGLKLCIKGTYIGLAFVLNKVKDVCGFICYPIKEQCANCCKKVDLYMNPYKDATIHQI